MAYAPWLVIFGETPSASKWNILGTNDAFFDTIMSYQSSYYLNSAENLAASSVATLVNIDTLEYDTGANFSVSTHLFTCPIAGRYECKASITMANTNFSTYVLPMIYKNGAEFRRNAPFAGPNSALTTAGASIATEISCAANDTLGFWAQQGIASTQAIQTGQKFTWFQVTYVGPT